MIGDTPDVRVVMEPVFLSKQDTCAALAGISVKTLEEEMRLGRINPRTLRGRVVFTPEEIRRYAAEQPAWEPK